VLAGLVLIPSGGILFAAGLEVAGGIVFWGGWVLAIGSIVVLAVRISFLGRQISSDFHFSPLPTFIFTTAAAGIAAEFPEAGAALGYVALLWFYLRWRLA
jgi:hypothetical protein